MTPNAISGDSVSKKDDGGALHPIYTAAECFHEGATLRDYFIAHAPQLPSGWFKPVMPERPKPPVHSFNPEQLEQFRNDMADTDPDNCDPAVLDFCRRLRDAYKAREDWDKEYEKQRYIQWPAAWADEMLKQRKL